MQSRLDLAHKVGRQSRNDTNKLDALFLQPQ